MERASPGRQLGSHVGEFVGLFEALCELDANDRRPVRGRGRASAAQRREIERQLTNLLSTSTSFREFRTFPRIQCDLPVEVETGQHARCEGTIVEVGSGGLLVRTSLPARRGDAVRISISHGDGRSANPLCLHGEVAWATAMAASGTPTLAISFSLIEVDATAHLQRLGELRGFIRELAKTSYGSF